LPTAWESVGINAPGSLAASQIVPFAPWQMPIEATSSRVNTRVPRCPEAPVLACRVGFQIVRNRVPTVVVPLAQLAHPF
jgi:hypothetical protein